MPEGGFHRKVDFRIPGIFNRQRLPDDSHSSSRYAHTGCNAEGYPAFPAAGGKPDRISFPPHFVRPVMAPAKTAVKGNAFPALRVQSDGKHAIRIRGENLPGIPGFVC